MFNNLCIVFVLPLRLVCPSTSQPLSLACHVSDSFIHSGEFVEEDGAGASAGRSKTIRGPGKPVNQLRLRLTDPNGTPNTFYGGNLNWKLCIFFELSGCKAVRVML